MDKLINFAVNILERENDNPELMPSQNPTLNPSQNVDINTSQNVEINTSQNPDINSTQNPNWKKNQWELFKQTVLWDALTEDQRVKCKNYLKSL